MSPIPRIDTKRLTLRAFEPRDESPYLAMMQNPRVTQYLADGRPLSAFEAWRQMAMFMGHWSLRGYGIWAVEERSSGRLVGRLGCFNPAGWPGFEIGYTLDEPAWGQGYAREGAGAALRFARETLGRTDIISVIRPANAGSVRVAEALGAVRAESIDFFGAPADIYRYPAQ